MIRIGIFFCALVLTACAVPGKFETESTVARVATKQALERGPAGPVNTLVLIPAGGSFIPINIRVMRTPDQAYIYALESDSKEVLTTQSTREFEVGDCVRLWHPPLAKSTDPKFSFVAGTLERGADCK